MQGISTIIATILILMITISLASLAYVSFISFFDTMKNSTDTAITQTVSNMMAQMKIESIVIEATRTAVYVRNIGKVDLTGFAAYYNDASVGINPATPSGGKIVPGNVSSINLTIAVPARSIIKITCAQGATAIQQAP